MSNGDLENTVIDTPKDGSEEWRLMSARIAWIFWLTARRDRFPASQETEAELWKEAAPEYRALVRKTLRALREEGIAFSKVT